MVKLLRKRGLCYEEKVILGCHPRSSLSRGCHSCSVTLLHIVSVAKDLDCGCKTDFCDFLLRVCGVV